MSKAEKLLTAFHLHNAGVEMKRLQIARRNRGASEEEVERLFRIWLEKKGKEDSLFFRKRNV